MAAVVAVRYKRVRVEKLAALVEVEPFFPHKPELFGERAGSRDCNKALQAESRGCDKELPAGNRVSKRVMYLMAQVSRRDSSMVERVALGACQVPV